MGFTLVCHVTMNEHVSTIAQTSYFEQCHVVLIHTFLTSTTTASVTSAFVLSRIDYCISMLFGSTLDVTPCFQRIQNYAFIVIVHIQKLSSIATHLKLLHRLLVKIRSTYKIACLCYHCHNSTAPSYVTDMLQK